MTTTKPVYHWLGVCNTAYRNCARQGNHDWCKRWEARIARIVKDHLPHGSGLDGDVTVDPVWCSDRSLLIDVDYHLMNDRGYYVGWTTVSVNAYATLTGINIDLLMSDDDGRPLLNDEETEERYPGLADYLVELFQDYLTRDVPCPYADDV